MSALLRDFRQEKKSIDNGNLQLTEKEFSLWGETMEYIENIALIRLKLTRKASVFKSTGSIQLPEGFYNYKAVYDPNITLTPYTQKLVLTLDK